MTNQARYSDLELEEFRVIVQDKLTKARQEYDTICGLLATDSVNTDSDTAPTYKSMEEGDNRAGRQQNAQLAQRQADFIKKLQAALVRIDNKTYGVCRVTGQLIPKERLRAVPHATLSIDAKR